MTNREEVLEIRKRLLKSRQEKEQLEVEIINTENSKKIKKLERRIKKLRKEIGWLRELYLRAQKRYIKSSEYPGHYTRGPYPLKNNDVEKVLKKFSANE